MPGPGSCRVDVFTWPKSLGLACLQLGIKITTSEVI